MTASRGLADRLAGGLLAGLGIAVGAEAATFDVHFLTDPVGPKALPLFAAAALVGSGLFLLARPGPAAAWPARPTLARMAGVVGTFGAYAALLAPLGFVVATTAAVGVTSMLFGGPWRRSLSAALALSVALWYLFVWGLDLPLPLGALWGALWTR